MVSFKKTSTLFQGLRQNPANCHVSHHKIRFYKFKQVCILLEDEIGVDISASQVFFSLYSLNVLYCLHCLWIWLKMSMQCKAQLVGWPLSWCTCACELASALSQYQQAVFHRTVAEAHEIRAESTKNNHTEPRDNPEPKHERETGGHCCIYHPTRIHPEERHRAETRCYCPTSLAEGGTGYDEFLCPRWLVNHCDCCLAAWDSLWSRQWLHLYKSIKR